MNIHNRADRAIGPMFWSLGLIIFIIAIALKAVWELLPPEQRVNAVLSVAAVLVIALICSIMAYRRQNHLANSVAECFERSGIDSAAAQKILSAYAGFLHQQLWEQSKFLPKEEAKRNAEQSYNRLRDAYVEVGLIDNDYCFENAVRQHRLGTSITTM